MAPCHRGLQTLSVRSALSPSYRPAGAGLHLYLRAEVPGGGRRSGQAEFYSSRRYLCVTGRHLTGTPLTIESRQVQLDALLRRLAAPYPTPTPAVVCTQV